MRVESSPRAAGLSAIVFDLDDTLLNREKTVTAENLCAIEESLANGMVIIFATARPHDALPHFLPQSLLERSWKICHNGAITIAPDGQMIASHAISAELFVDLMDWTFAKIPATRMSWYSLGKWYTHTPLDSAARDAYGIAQQANVHPLPMQKHYRDHDERPVEKILLPWFALNQTFTALHGDRVSIKTTKDQALTMLMARDTSKAAAMNTLLPQIGCNMDQVLVFGDDHNDLELFQQFPHSVAMANAIPELKTLARYHAGHHDLPDSIARVLRNQLG